MRGLINRRYQIVRRLGRGGMGIVYLVEDTLNANRQLALKMLHSHVLESHSLAQFKYEFSALRQLRHPNLLEVYDFDCTQTGRFFFTMEYVPGEDLPRLLPKIRSQASEPGGYTWLYDVIVQVCRALQYLHSRGLIHHDVKPGNIRINPDGQARLMDCGLIGEPRDQGHFKIRGTPEYIAPEIIRGEAVDHRVDLYSLGVSIYELVTRRLPFTGDSSIMILRQHVEDLPQPPGRFVAGIPGGLQGLILKLMAKEPAQRFASAEDIIQAINGITTGPHYPVETRATRHGYILSGRLVGREFELDYLQGLLLHMLQGEGRVVLLGGPTGVGKSRLVREIKLQAQLRRVLVCEGTCREQARTPYHALAPVLEQLIAFHTTARQKIPPASAAALVKLAPDLAGQIGSLAANRKLPKDQQGLLEAITSFLIVEDRPLMLVFDDLHYADQEMLDFLKRLSQSAGTGHLMVIGLFRDDEHNENAGLSELVSLAQPISARAAANRETGDPKEPQIDLLEMKALDEACVRVLLETMLGIPQPANQHPSGRVIENLLPKLMAETGGIPLFIESIMRSLVDEDLLVYDGDQWQVDIDHLREVHPDIESVFQRRLARLTREELDLLQWAAVLGRRIDLQILADLSGQPPERVFQALSSPVSLNLVALSAPQDGSSQYHFSSDHAWQSVYGTLSPEEKAFRHRMIGEALLSQGSENERAAVLAWHFERAGGPALAMKYSILAGEQAGAMYANETSIQHFSHALSLAEAHPGMVAPEDIFRILERREPVYALLGERQAQQADLERMEAIATQSGDIPRKIDVINRRASLAVLVGQHNLALQAGDESLALARQIGQPALEAESLLGLSDAYYWLDDFVNTQVFGQQALQIYQQLDDPLGEAKSLRILGMALRRQNKPKESKQHYEKALSIYRSLGNRTGEADILNALGVVESNFAHKRSWYEQSLSIIESTGDSFRLGRAYNNLGLLYSNLGLYQKACSYLERAVSSQRESQALPGLVYSLESLGRVYLELGEYERAGLLLQEGQTLAVQTRSPLNESLYWLALGRVALAQDRASDAVEKFENACAIQRQLGMTIYLTTSLAWLGCTFMELGDHERALQCTSEATHYLETTGSTGSFPSQDVWWYHYLAQRKQQYAKGSRSADMPADAWHSLQRAHDTMLSAIATLSDEGLRRNYLNRIRINRNILTEWARYSSNPLSDLESETQTPLKHASLTAGELQNVKDKFKRVLDISLRMNETRDVRRLMDYVMDQVIELSGAERGFLVLFDENGLMDFKVSRGIAEAELERQRTQLSYTVMGKVAQTRQPVLLQDALADEHFGRQTSVLDLHLRSVLCVPLLLHNDLIGAIYVDNRSIGGRFLQEDLDLLTIFASQAATAIENAHLHEETLRVNKELERAAQTLEQRVSARTAELKKRERELQSANRELTQRALQLRTNSQVAQYVTSLLDLEQLLAEVVKLIQSQIGYHFVGVWLLSDDERSVELRAGTLVDESPAPRLVLSIEQDSIITSVCNTGQYRFIADARSLTEGIACLAHSRCELALPLRMGQRTIGALDIHTSLPAAFSDDERMVLQTLADQTAIAIRNAQLFKKEQERRRLAEALEVSGREISSSLNIREVPGRVLEQLARVVPYERGSILLSNGSVLSAIALRGFPARVQPSQFNIPIRPGDVYQQVVERRQPLVVEDTLVEKGWQQLEWLETHHSWLGVPLITKGRIIGMISLTRKARAAFTPQDANRAISFAVHAAIALENAGLVDKITQLNEDLDAKVRQRTHELDLAYRNLERLDRAKSDFIDIAAHELRTPLTTIHGYSYLLLDSPQLTGDEEMQTLVQGILRGANSLHEIINSMLDVAQIDNQTLLMRQDWTHLSMLMEGVQAEFDLALSDRRLTLDHSGLKGLPEIRVDSGLFYKVFYHLVMNAIKFTPDGGRITVSGQVTGGEPQPAELELVVSDTGIGIAPEEQQVIFEKFYQAGRVSFHSSGRTKYKGGGPGLGLAIVRGIVLAHGGQIWVESPGYHEQDCPGSHFHIRLPLS